MWSKRERENALGRGELRRMRAEPVVSAEMAGRREERACARSQEQSSRECAGPRPFRAFPMENLPEACAGLSLHCS